jgi:hypothetical protein
MKNSRCLHIERPLKAFLREQIRHARSEEKIFCLHSNEQTPRA